MFIVVRFLEQTFKKTKQIVVGMSNGDFSRIDFSFWVLFL